MKKYKLAIVAPHIGTPSETFIMRHMAELAPGQTVVIVNQVHPLCNQPSWNFPIFEIDKQWKHLHYKLARFIARRLHLWQPCHQLLPAKIPVKRFLRDSGVQVILGEYLNYTHPWIKIAAELNIPIFAHAHGYDVSKLLQDEEWRNKYCDYNSTQGIITMNKESRVQLLDIGLLPNKVHTAPYGIHVPSTPVKRNNKRQIQCLAVGRMVGKKAPIKLLESFRYAAANNTQLRLNYVGDGDLLPNVQQYLKKWNLEDKVTLYGVLSNQEVLNLMRKTDIFIQHSITDPVTGDKEGLPVAILEAMANSLPVVSTRHAGIPEAVVENSTGYLVDEGDTEGMAKYIGKLGNNSALRDQFGKAGWVRAKKHFSWEQEKSTLLKFLGLTIENL